MRAITAVLLAAAAASLPASAIELSNFKSGIACTNSRLPNGDPQGWICHSTAKVLVSDHGSCTYDGEKKLCTWIGFEFDYRNAKKDQKIHCTMTSSEPSNSGNPEGIIAKGIRTEQWEFSLPPGEGHFFNPQYVVFTVRDPGKESLVQRTTCRVEGEILFETNFEFVFPAVKISET